MHKNRDVIYHTKMQIFCFVMNMLITPSKQLRNMYVRDEAN